MNRYISSPHPQGSSEWLQDRCGRLNGSDVAAIFAAVKTGEAAARRDLRFKLVLERITGKPVSSDFTSKEMVWGTETEPHARMAFEMANDLTVRECGYCYSPDSMMGASPDGLIEENGKIGIIEIKAPKSATHLGYLDGGVIPSIYQPQVNHTMLVTGAAFAYFVSYDPRFPEKLQRFQVRIERDQAKIDAHERAVLQFLEETATLEQQLRLRAA